MLDEKVREPTGPVLPRFSTDQYIGGELETGSGEDRSIISPSDGRLLAVVADANASDLDRAVKAAHSAKAEWRSVGPASRANSLRQVAQRIRENADELALIDALDSGNPVKGMHFDAMLGATLVDYFAGIATEVKGETIPQRGDRLTYVAREPIGVVARLVAFNHPLLFACAKLAAPVAAGNCVLLKPSEETPLSALRLAELVGDLFPKGVLTVITGGAELGQSICTHPGIAAVGLIGSVTTGKAVLKSTSQSVKRTQLELGGKNALVICPDADLDAAVEGAVKGMNLGWTVGQSCGSTSRVLVHDSLYEQLVREITEKFNSVRLGDPTDPATEMGSLSTPTQYSKVLGFIQRAERSGATIAAGGPPVGVSNEGYYVRPTLITNVSADMEIASEEVFGPVLSVQVWSNEAEMLDIVNGLDVGLTASVWTRDLDTAMRLTDRIQAGYVWVNDSSDHYLGAPFGGVKHSGLGREECLEELLAYTEAKTVTIVSRT